MRPRWRGVRRRITALALTAGLVATTTAVVHAEDSREPGAGTDVQRVTLITGDRVRVAGGQVVGYEPGPGRSNVPLHKYSDKGRHFAVPGDAEPLVASGKLDRRLFDVTSLVEFGYDDAQRDNLPVIVRPAASAGYSGVSAMSAQQQISTLGAVSGEVPKSGKAWESLRSGAVGKVWLDGVRRPVLDHSTRQIGADKAWEAGFTGKGVKVAVVDSGVDEKHPDLAGKQVAEKNFTDQPDITDLVGHGTHVAATIASGDATYRGVAPDAQILDAKACHLGGCRDSAIIAAMQWSVEQGAAVVNISLGGTDAPGVDAVEEAVNRLSRESGALFVVAAGNQRMPEPENISSPGTAEEALTVGAVDREDNLAPFSLRGPTLDGAVKPDVTAPGVGIAAAKANTPDHVAMSGTSMATPHVAGVAALLKQQHPDWPGQRIKAQVMSSAKPNPQLTAYDQGAGRVDVPKTLMPQVTTEPANINFGPRQWPHADDEKVVREITYRNPGSEPVTLDLGTDVKGPGGKAPAGMFTLSQQKITVPAGGETKVTITADTTVSAPDGAYNGAVVTSTGVRTLLGTVREVESYDVPFKVLDDHGQPTDQYKTVFIDTGSGARYEAIGALEQKELRLPKGDYLVRSMIDISPEKQVFVVQPKLVLTSRTELTFDTRTAKPVVLGVPDAQAKARSGSITFDRTVGGERHYDAWNVGKLTGEVWTAQLGPGSPDASTTFSEDLSGTPRDERTPVTYRLMWTEQGRVPTGYERTARAAELAEMTVGYRSDGPGYYNAVGALGLTAGGGGGGTATLVPDGGHVVELVTAADASWSWFYDRSHEQRGTQYGTTTPYRTVQAGRKYALTMNTAIMGPSVPEPAYGAFSRLGNEMAIRTPLFTDRNGGNSYVVTTSARMTLFRDGAKVLDVAGRTQVQFSMPGADAAYRLEMEQNRVSDLSPKVTAVWTFKSGYTKERTALQQTVVRFLPELDTEGTAHGRTLLVPLKIEQQPGTPKVRTLTVEVSFDDGKTWRRVPVAGDRAVVQHQKGAQFASLRTKTVDAAGNTGEVTITRAYRIAP